MKMWLLMAFMIGAGVTPPSHADDDHNRARSAVVAGDILPLKKILEQLDGQRPGQVLEVELENEDGAWVYEIRLLQPMAAWSSSRSMPEPASSCGNGCAIASAADNLRP